MTEFNVGENSLSGDISGWNLGSGNLSNLEYFRIGNNSFSGDISGWNLGGGNLTNLEEFSLYGNSFSGDISGWNLGSGNLTDLKYFLIDSNSLSGDISGWNLGSGNLTDLIKFIMYNNSFSGDISGWNLGGGNLTNLVDFHIGNNSFSGDISGWNLNGGGLINLIHFYIQNNKFVHSDLEDEIPGINAILNHDYAPQADIDSVRTVKANKGGTLTITPELAINPSGNDSYEWFKDGSSLGVSSTSNRIFTKTAVVEDTGLYTYRVINTVTSDLILNSTNGITVEIVGISVDTTGVVNTTESGGDTTFTIKLDSEPIADVTIGISSDDTTEGTVFPTSLTFTDANWNSPQTVTVTGVDDMVVDGTVAYNIVTAVATSTDTNYNGINTNDVVMNNTDDDTVSGNVLIQIGNEADDPDTVNSVVTVAELVQILPALTNLTAGNETAYQDYIDANPNSFSSTATQAEVQAMINQVNSEVIANNNSNTVLAQIGNEADDPDTVNSVVTVAEFGQILPALTNLTAGNETAYQDYIDANPNSFSSPATQAEVQVMIDAVNKIQSALKKIKAYAENSSNPVPTVDDYMNVGVTGVNADNLSTVNEVVDAVTENKVDTVAKIQALVEEILGVNSTSTEVPIYRLYNRKTGAQLYTKGIADKDKILNKFKDFEFTDGVPAFYASIINDGTTPIFRLYNRKTGAQLYTKGIADKDKILNKFKDFEFTDGVPAFYASIINDGTTPIFIPFLINCTTVV